MSQILSVRLRRTQKITILVTAVVWTVFWAVTSVVSGLPPQTAGYALLFTALPWASAAVLMLRRWWPVMSTLDTPGRLLAVAVAALPERRRDWGMAMLVELDEVTGRSARWRFALSGVRAAVMLPPAFGWPVLALAGGVVVAAAIAAGPVVGGFMPGMEVFAISFVAIFGALATGTLASATRPRLSALLPGLVVGEAVAAAVAITSVFLRQDPSASAYLPPVTAVFLAAVLAGCLWVAVARPGSKSAKRFAPYLGVGAALVYVAAFVVLTQIVYQTDIPRASREALGMMAVLLMLFAPPAVLFAVAFGAGLIGKSFRSGLRAGLWAGVAGVPLMYSAWLLQSLHTYKINSGLLLFGDGAPEAENLGAATNFCVLMVVLFGPPFAVLGAALGARMTTSAPKSD